MKPPTFCKSCGDGEVFRIRRCRQIAKIIPVNDQTGSTERPIIIMESGTRNDFVCRHHVIQTGIKMTEATARVHQNRYRWSNGSTATG